MGGHHHHETSPARLLFVIILNFIITGIQVFAGIVSGSLALISDALHNLTDAFSIVITYISIKIARRPGSYQYTFGWKRAEVLAALLNASLLIIISFYLFKEAYIRFFNPEPISGMIMIGAAFIGLVANTAGMMLLHRGSSGNLNIKSAYLHLFTDAVSSIAVLLGGAVIYFWDIYFIDPLLTILIGIYVLKASYGIVKETTRILMMSTPAHINLKEIKERLEAIPEINDVHHIHIWALNEQDIHFESHVKVENMSLRDSSRVRKKIESILGQEYNIHHVTTQFECTCNE